MPPKSGNVLDLPVEEFLDNLRFAGIREILTKFIDEFELKDAVLVGSEDRLQGIITTIDVLRYFYHVARPYIMLREIELAIRALIVKSVDQEKLEHCIELTIKDFYQKQGKQVPRFEEMTLNDYVMLLRHGDTWECFSTAFGKNRILVYARIERLPELRNNVFHFKKEISLEEYDYLSDARDWLLNRVVKHESTGGEK